MPDLDFLFHPQSIAIVGTPSDPTDMQGGAVFLHALVRSGYKGDIYPVNPKLSEILGLKSYPDLLSVPQGLDYVICCLPASLTPQLIRDCALNGVKAVSIYTAGFSEAGEEGGELEQELVSLARQGGIRLIGPNCMGIYCPTTGLSYHSGFSKDPGCVGLLCQSGGNSNTLTLMGGDRGIRFSKVISYGNAADLNETDFLEYLSQDDETRVIAAYIEGIKGGPRFLKALARAAEIKPVMILKGGRTQAGTRAATSHTGALASASERWDALCRQAGAIQVYTLEEMLDLVETALYMKPPNGRRVGVIGWGGGASVTNTDACENAGLSVLTFSSQLSQQLRRFTFGPGSSVNNPVDSAVLTSPSLLSETIRIVADSKEVDLLLIHMPLATPHMALDSETETWKAAYNAIIETGRSLDIPIALVQPCSDTPESWEVFFSLHQRCVKAGLPLYSTGSQAAQAISRYVQYHIWKSREGA